MLIVFNKERLVFDARDYLDDFDTTIINLPISIEVKYFDGVAPCGLALKINKCDLQEIEQRLSINRIEIERKFWRKNNDQEYKEL